MLAIIHILNIVNNFAKHEDQCSRVRWMEDGVCERAFALFGQQTTRSNRTHTHESR